MGCCNSTNNFSPEQLDFKIVESIKSGNTKALLYYISLKSKDPQKPFNLNATKIASGTDVEMTIPALCVLAGNGFMLRLLNETFQVDFKEMEKTLNTFGTSTLAVICENNYLDLFQFYCNIYMKIRQTESQSLRPAKECFFVKAEGSLYDFCLEYPDAELSPIQMACIQGNITIIKALLSFSSNLKTIPVDLDAHYREKNYGFNCALLACMTGNYNMIKFLFNSCKADFNLVSLADESCIQLLFVSAKSKSRPELYNCLIYLVDKVKVNIAYNYESVLVYCDAFKTSDYFIKKLQEAGIEVDKEYLKKKYGLFRQNTFGSFTEANTDLKSLLSEEPDSPKTVA